VAASTNGETTCGLKNDGSLWCWGYDFYGQAGIGSTLRLPYSIRTPTQVGSDYDWFEVSVGGMFTCGRRAGGHLWCWGDNRNGQLGIGSRVESNVPVEVGGAHEWSLVAAATNHFACGLDTAGAVWCWGANLEGELGDDSAPRLAPVAPVGTDRWNQLAAG